MAVTRDLMAEPNRSDTITNYMDRLPTQFPGCQPPHPGFFIGEVLADLGTNLTMFAEKICEPENVAMNILRGNTKKRDVSCRHGHG